MDGWSQGRLSTAAAAIDLILANIRWAAKRVDAASFTVCSIVMYALTGCIGRGQGQRVHLSISTGAPQSLNRKNPGVRQGPTRRLGDARRRNLWSVERVMKRVRRRTSLPSTHGQQHD